MPRKRYPSDEERLKRPSGVTIAFSVMTPDPDHPGHAVVFNDPEKRGIWTGLLLVAGHGFAGRTEDRVTLSDALLSWCTGRTPRAHALRAMRTVCDLMEYTVDDRGHSVVVHVKNLSQNQGWTPQTPRSAPRTPSAPESESESESEVQEPTRPSGVSDAPTGSPNRLVNLLSKLPGELDEKTAWLEANLDLIEAEAEAGTGTLKTITIRYYRNYAKAPEGKREYFDWTAKQRTQARIDAGNKAERAAGPHQDPPIPPEMARMFPDA